jgi:hypothetical protein
MIDCISICSVDVCLREVYLGGQSDGVVIGLDANGLVVGVALVLATVLVDKVQRVAGELHTTGLLALDEEGVVRAYIENSSQPMLRSPFLEATERRYWLCSWEGAHVRVTCQMTSELRLSYCVDILAVFDCAVSDAMFESSIAGLDSVGDLRSLGKDVQAVIQASISTRSRGGAAGCVSSTWARAGGIEVLRCQRSPPSSPSPVCM